MSNCVTILTPLMIPGSKFDPAKREQFCETVRRVSYLEHHDPLAGAGDHELAFWWYMTDKNVSSPDGYDVCIDLGNARSSHTFRDLGWTLTVIASFLKETFKTSLRATEEGDGNSSTFTIKVTLMPGRPAQMIY